MEDIKLVLLSYRQTTKRIDALLEERERLRQYRILLVNRVYSGKVKNTPQHSKIEAAVVKVDEIEATIADEIMTLNRKRDAVRDIIDEIGDGTLATLLSLRYLRGMRWEKIAVEMNYGYRHVLKLHKKALSILREKNKDGTLWHY